MCHSLSYIVAGVNSPDDLVAVADAVDQFGVSKRTLERLIAERSIHRYRRIGDRKMYVSRSEVVKHLGFQEVRAPYD